MLESWITLLVVAVPLVWIGGTGKLTNNQKILAAGAVIIIFLALYLSGSSGGPSYLEQACPGCNE